MNSNTSRKSLWAYVITVVIALPIIFALLAVASCDVAEAKKKSPTETIRVITHNIAGGAIHLGDPIAISRVNKHIAEYHPHVVMLQEVCSSQVAAFQKDHPSWNLTVSETRFSHPGCDGDKSTVDAGPDQDVRGDELYDLVASPLPMRNETHINLQEESHSRIQWLTCAQVKLGQWITACSTHLKVAWAEQQAVELGGMEPGQRERQILRVAWWVKQFAQAGPVVVGGDFNAEYNDPIMKPMRSFQEYVRDIDDVFYSAIGTAGTVEGSAYKEISDHPLVRSSAQFR